MNNNQNQEKMLKQLVETLSHGQDAELSLDDLDQVNGGFTSSSNGDTVTINFTDSEYAKLKEYLETDVAKGIIANTSLANYRLARTMVFSAEDGKNVLAMLDFFKSYL